ncbi:phage tail protein [Lelliottia amnigena]|uniref:Phage tail protein n=1 Tax=Lelliottia amnigena TaxID=61646 RepID=A0AAP2F259_LELAM|nr:phage tail protein [Lelliottia amnigena]MBL5901717.1 phage tail protein [Lelliottia amnigena]MBL5937231.1 phage tail protein [Lelliottia amnigena]
MSTTITLAFEAYLAAQTAAQQPVVLDEFIFANVPGIDPEAPVDPAEGIPQTHIVWRQTVDKSGVINSDTVVYSVLLGTEVGDFTFNWIGLINKSSGMLAMVTHIPPQDKYANVDGNQGNALTRSFVMEYSGAQAATLINVPAETWQIDFTARLGAMDEHDRVTNVDLYGPGAFFGDGFLVRESAGAYSIQPGAGYVGGLRVSLGAAAPVNAATRPTKVWVDASWTGTAASVWNTQQTITVAPTLANYVQDGVSHYVFAVAQINADGSVTDLRPKGTVDGGQQASQWLRKDKNLSDVNDADEARKNIGCGTSATKDIVTSPTDTTAGRVLTVGAGGLLGGPRDTTIANELFASFWRDTSIVKSGITIPYDGSPTINYFAVDGANHHAYIGRKAGANPISWVKIFSEFNKPTAADTGAVAKAGDTMTGRLIMNVDGEAIRLKPKTAGSGSYIISQDSVGANHWYVGAGSANNSDVQLVNYKAANSMVQLKADGSIYVVPTNGKAVNVPGQITVSETGKGMWVNQNTSGAPLYQNINNAATSEYWPIFKQHYTQANSTWSGGTLINQGDFHLHYLNSTGATTNFSFRNDGQFIPGSYANFDARYYTQSAANAKFITGVRHGTEGSQGTHDSLATSKAPSGCVLTGIKSNYNDGNWEVDTIYFRPEQVQLNGNWINTGYSTALLTTPAHIKSLPRSGLSSLLNLRPCLSEAVADNDGNIIPGTADYVDENGYLWSVASRALAGSIFIGVDDAGIIRQIDADATMLRPDGLSVYGLDALPDGCTIDGNWIFDGNDVTPAPVNYAAEAEKLKTSLMREAEAIIAPLQRAVKYGMATDAEKALLGQWEVYTVLLSRVDTSLAPDIEWPPVPVSK